ncbi:MAG TPA: methyl-accepting chemotaxis protein, partial [Oligoflexia bacterium]|nr:methyl-accepting chemotaxis protein [Oligoflexia bacterium]
MKLKTKLVGGFIICALITLLAGGVGYLYIGQLRDHIHEIVAEQLPALAAVTEATVSLEELAAALNQAANPVLDTDEFKEMQSRIEEKRAEYRKAQEAYASTARSSEEEAVWQEYLTAVAKWRETNVAATAKVNEFEGRGLRNMTGMLKSENPAQAVAAFSEMHDSLLARSEKQGAETIALLRRLAQLKGQTLAQDAKIAEEEAARARAITLGAVFVGFVIALCLGIALAMSIVKPVNVLTEASSVLAAINEEMAHAAAAIADGDLTRDVRAEDESTKLALSGQAGDDELGQLMRAFGAMAGHQRTLGGAMAKMSENLNKVLYGINESIAQVASGSQQVSDASQSLSQGATEQAASLEEISSSMTEVGSQTKTNAENAA